MCKNINIKNNIKTEILLMRKFTKKLMLSLLSMLFVSGSAIAADSVTFEIFEDFDDVSHFTESTTVPDGWKSEGSFYPFARMEASIYNTGYNAKSGSYVMHTESSTMATRDEVIYTPLKKLVAGKPCTISFSFYAPGGSLAMVRNYGLVVKAGNDQTLDAQTIEVGKVTSQAYAEWTDFAFSFTPEAEGEYCFSIALDASANTLSLKGVASFDDILIEGYTVPDAPPVEIVADPIYLNFPMAYIGESYTGIVNVKGSNLTGDIVLKNISTSELVTSVSTIPMVEASSETGYDLTVTASPTTVESFGGTIELHTEGLAEPVVLQIYWNAIETTEVASLASLIAGDPEQYITYKYVGEAIVTYVDAVNGYVYMQDATAGVRVIADNISNIKIGDKISTQYVSLQQDEDGLTIVASTETLNVVSNDNVVVAQDVTLRSLARNINRYANKLVRVREVSIADIDEPVFSESKVTITDGANGTLLPFAGSDLIGAEKPNEVVNVIGIVTSSTDAIISPRSLADIEELVLEPNSDNFSSAYEVPYYNTFDNYDGDYDGTTVVPAGWLTVGSSPFFTANITDVDAVTGSYYLVADESEINNRDDRVYTPMFRLTAGTEYTISYYLYMPGNSGGGVLRDTDLRVTVGSEQDFDFHPKTMQLIEDQSITSWTKQEFTFTPEMSGAYCFAFSMITDVNYSGLVAIDDFNITAPGLIKRPTADFGIGGVFDIIDSDMLVYPGQPVAVANLSKYADEYAWEVTCPGGSVLTSEDESPEFNFNESGNYSIKLTVSNVRATRSTTKSVNVECIEPIKETYSLMTFNPNHDALKERGLIPAFVEDGNEDTEYDFATGYNRYYTKLAERFDVPANVDFEITSLYTWLANYRNRAYTSGYDSEKPFEVVIYGETNGKLDESKVYGRVTSTLMDLFGNTGIGGTAGEPRLIDFNTILGAPIKVNGPFYVALEFASDMTVKTDDSNMGRSYIAFNAVKHSTDVSTLYVKPHAVPEYATIQADGNWYPVDMLDNTMKGIGAYFVLWVNSKYENSSIAINTLGETVFAIRLLGDDLHVSGTNQGEQVIVYNINGVAVAFAVGQDGGTMLNLGHLLSGTYVVKTESGVSKFVK